MSLWRIIQIKSVILILRLKECVVFPWILNQMDHSIYEVTYIQTYNIWLSEK